MHETKKQKGSSHTHPRGAASVGTVLYPVGTVRASLPLRDQSPGSSGMAGEKRGLSIPVVGLAKQLSWMAEKDGDGLGWGY